MTGLFAPIHPGPHDLARIRVTSTHPGIIIGEIGGQPLTVDLLQRRPLGVVMIGQLPAAQQLALRVIGAGARVVTLTYRPHSWYELARAALLPPDFLLVTTPGTDLPRPSHERPVLVVHDTGVVPQERPTVPGQWRPVLHILPGVHPAAAPILTNADVLAVQTLTGRHAALLGELLNLDARVVDDLKHLQADQMAVLTRGRGYRIRLVGPPEETAILRTAAGR